MQFHAYNQAGADFGPFSEADVRRLIKDGTFKPDKLIRPLSGGKWKSANLVIDLDAVEDSDSAREARPNGNTRHTGQRPTFMLFQCINCSARIRISIETRVDLPSVFRCTSCSVRYSLSDAESDGVAVVIVPLQNASHRETKQSKRPSHVISALATIELEETANWTAVRGNYRQLVAKYHPDRVQHLGKELQDLASRKTKDYNAAYAILEDWFRYNEC